jgi:hypothetical protein
MIGRKKLSTIRQELHEALTAAGDDPLQWLERRMATAEGRGVDRSGGSEVLESLRRFLESPKTGKPPKRRARAKR